MISSINNSYAAVLFDLGKQNNKLRNYFESATELLGLLEHNDEFSQLIGNTSIDKNERRQIVTDLLGHDLDEAFIYFL
jgi:F0F1-type ATP synthase delta subunit